VDVFGKSGASSFSATFGRCEVASAVDDTHTAATDQRFDPVARSPVPAAGWDAAAGEPPPNASLPAMRLPFRRRYGLAQATASFGRTWQRPLTTA
jgi:hypothetical protein